MTKYTKAMSQEEMISRLKSLHIELRYMVDAVEAIKKNIEYKNYVEYNNRTLEKDDWIPCSERLPENDDWVIVSMNYDRKAHGDDTVYWRNVTMAWYDGAWRTYGMEKIEEPDGESWVVAWQPLPKPYKGDTEKAKERKIPLYAYASWDRSEE